MVQKYEYPFHDLCEQIRHYSPGAIPLLENIREGYGSQVGYHAAFIIVYIWNRQQYSPSPDSYNPVMEDLKEFTFFEDVKDIPAALTLFERLLFSYKRDQAKTSQTLQDTTCPSDS